MGLYGYGISAFLGCSMLILAVVEACSFRCSTPVAFDASERQGLVHQEVVDSSVLWADSVLVKMREATCLGSDWVALTEQLVQEHRFHAAWEVLMSFAQRSNATSGDEGEELRKAQALMGMLVVRMYRLQPSFQSFLLHRDALLACGRILWFCTADREELLCILCTNLPLEPALLPCGHFFCLDCLCMWLEEAMKLGNSPGCGVCPYCRSPLRAFAPSVDKRLGVIMRKRERGASCLFD
mmetsp:Transcript_15972/g.53477  ORF Transcript_15972/g.53477 Transcript_15972/m.53477 type:complete len:239 (+) Transcript_15972:287-1003(+)